MYDRIIDAGTLNVDALFLTMHDSAAICRTTEASHS
jgi:hypothetical protein